MTIQDAASELVGEFFRQLKLGLESPASFEVDYNEEEVLRLDVEFTEYGGGPSPDDEPYKIYVEDYEFSTFVNLRWVDVNTKDLGITIKDFRL